MIKHKHKFCILAACLTLVTLGAHGDMILQENFDTSTSGWSNYAGGQFTLFTNSLTFGNPAGSLFGEFAAQALPVPRLDAFRADAGASGGQYARDYTELTNFLGWTFSLYTTNNLPTTLTFGFNAGTNGFFSYPLTLQFTQAQTWVSLFVPGTFNTNWTGGDAPAFSIALTTVQSIELQISDANLGGQRYYLDGVGVVIPEPITVMLGLVGCVAIVIAKCIKQRSPA